MEATTFTFDNCVQVIQSADLTSTQIQTVLRLLAARYPKPKKKKVAKPKETPPKMYSNRR